MANGKYKQWLTEEGLIKIQGWAMDGLTDKQIASNIGISEKTLYEWKKKYGKFCKSLKRGKEIVDREVENALLKRALGYSYQEYTETTDADGSTTTKIVTKHVIPDTTAQIFWLKNRKPDKWRDKREVEQSAVETKAIDFTNITDDELRRLASLGENKA